MASGAAATNHSPLLDSTYLCLQFANQVKQRYFTGEVYAIREATFQIAKRALEILLSGKESELQDAIANIPSKRLRKQIRSLTSTCGGKEFSVLTFLPSELLRDKKFSDSEIGIIKQCFLQATVSIISLYLKPEIRMSVLGSFFSEQERPSQSEILLAQEERHACFAPDISVPSWLKGLVNRTQHNIFNNLCANWDYIQRTFSQEQLDPQAEDSDKLLNQRRTLLKKLMLIALNTNNFDLFLREWPCSTEKFIDMPLAEAELKFMTFTRLPQIQEVSIQQIISSFPDALTTFLSDRYNVQMLQGNKYGGDKINSAVISGIPAQDVFAGLANLLSNGFKVELLVRLFQEEPEKLEALLLYATEGCYLFYKNIMDLLVYDANQLVVALCGMPNIKTLIERYDISLEDVLACVPKGAAINIMQINYILVLLERHFLFPMLDRNIALQTLVCLPIAWHRLVEIEARRLGPKEFKRAVNKHEVSFIFSPAFPEYLKTIRIPS